MGMELRRAELAGAWYPSDAEGVERIVESFEAEARPCTSPQRARAAVAPHAGWVFSGSIAYSALAALAARAPSADAVVLFAGHLSPRAPVTLLGEGACETPLGPLEVDRELVDGLLQRRPEVRRETPTDHTQDNSAEVLFPLLKHLFPEASLVVVGAPPHRRSLEFVDELLDVAEGLSRELVFVGSTDLTHYGPNYRFTPQGQGPEAERWVREVNDAAFLRRAQAAETSELIAEALGAHNACCPGAAAAAIAAARAFGARRGEVLRYGTSADIRPSSSFVGYAGVVF